MLSFGRYLRRHTLVVAILFAAILLGAEVIAERQAAFEVHASQRQVEPPRLWTVAQDETGTYHVEQRGVYEAEEFWPEPEWWVAAGTVALVLATIALFVATFGLYRKTAEALAQSRDEADRARQHSRELFFSERRPWIKIRASLESDITPKEGGLDFKVLFVTSNVGNSPAFNIKVMPFVMPFEWSTSVEDLQRVTRVEMSGVKSETLRGHTLFPGDEFPQRIDMRIKPDEIAEATGTFLEDTAVPTDVPRENILVAIAPSVFGTVRYSTSLDETIHQTGFIFRLGAKTEGEELRIPLSIFPPHGIRNTQAWLFPDDRGFWAD